MRVGARVVIERDETLYPSRGTWPQFRAKRGTVVEVNGDEFGVVFRKVSVRPDRPGVLRWNQPATWFKAYELKETGK